MYRSLQNRCYSFRMGADLENTDTNSHAKFPQVSYSHNSHRCSIPQIPIDVLFLKVAHSKGLRPLPPTPKKQELLNHMIGNSMTNSSSNKKNIFEASR